MTRIPLAFSKRSDQRKLEESLGPRAKVALRQLQKDPQWIGPRSEPSKRGNEIAIGYRFEVAGLWSEPSDSFEPGLVRPNPEPEPDVAEIPTVFTSRTGAECDSRVVRFVRVAIRDGRRGEFSRFDPVTHKWTTTRGPAPEWALDNEYVVESDLSELLLTLKACSTAR